MPIQVKMGFPFHLIPHSPWAMEFLEHSQPPGTKESEVKRGEKITCHIGPRKGGWEKGERM